MKIINYPCCAQRRKSPSLQLLLTTFIYIKQEYNTFFIVIIIMPNKLLGSFISSREAPSPSARQMNIFHVSQALHRRLFVQEGWKWGVSSALCYTMMVSQLNYMNNIFSCRVCACYIVSRRIVESLVEIFYPESL